MRALALAALAMVLAACSPADPRARAAMDWNDCEVRPNPMRQLQACSAVIENQSADADRRAQALLNRAVLRSDLGQYARAIADLGRAHRLTPNDPRISVERGEIHRLRGAYNDALHAVDEALSIEPSMPDALNLRDELIAERRNAGENQIVQISRALANDPRNAQLLNERCWYRAIAGEELDAALQDCNGAIAADPQFAAAFDSRGLVNLKRGAFQDALADYEAALKIEPDRGHYLYGRGVVRIAMGDKEGGEADLAAAEREQPGVGSLYASYGVGR